MSLSRWSCLELGTRRPRAALAVVVGLTVAMATGLPKVHLESAIENTLPEDSPARVADRAVRATFDARPVVVVGFVTEADAFNHGTLAKLSRFTRLLEEMVIVGANGSKVAALVRTLPAGLAEPLRTVPEAGFTRETWTEIENGLSARTGREHSGAVDRALREIRQRLYPFDEVISLASVDAIEGTPDGLLVGPVFDEVPETPDDLRSLRQRVMSDRLLRGRLVSEDATSLAILAAVIRS